MKEVLKNIWSKFYGPTDQAVVAFAPGRVNLLGEHTDCYGGHVLPCAIDLGTWAVGRLRSDQSVRLRSDNFPHADPVSFDVSDLSNLACHGWANYPKSVLWAMRERGIRIRSGFDMLFFGTLPRGTGLSSSASIEMATAAVLSELFGLDLLKDGRSRAEMAEICKDGENRFIGVQSGIMDQFAIALGKKGHCLSLDCSDLSYRFVALPSEGHAILIMDSGKKRDLASSQYNLRREETEEARSFLKKSGIIADNLAELSPQEFAAVEGSIPGETARRRARHVVWENDRARRGAEALEKGDLATFGNLMNRSHLSLQFDYDVTCRELDCLASYCWQHRGCLGARMTGAGFGGSVVALVERDSVQSIVEDVSSWYCRHTGLEASVIETGASRGVWTEPF